MTARLLSLAACLIVSAGLAEAKLKPMMRSTLAPAHVESSEPGVSELGDDGVDVSPPEPGRPPLMLKVSFRIKFEDLEGSGNFMVANATQSNYVVGGDKPRLIENSQGKGVEFKKFGTIVNMLPVVDIERPELVDAQIQVEISGPGRPMTELNVPPLQTFQLQTEFVAALGRKVVLVDEPNKRVEVTVEIVKP